VSSELEALTWEQVIAALSLNAAVQQAADDHVGDCAECWKAIAHNLAAEVVAALSTKLGEPTLIYDDTGAVRGLNGDVVHWVGAMSRLASTPPECIHAT